MSYRYAGAAFAFSGLISGCSTLTESIEQRISVSEKCRLATSLAPASLNTTGPLASIQLGNIGVCGINAEHLLPMCSIDQIVSSYGLLDPPGNASLEADKANSNEEKRLADVATNVTAMKNTIRALREAMDALATEVATIDIYFQSIALTMNTGQLSARVDALKGIERKAGDLQKKLASVRREKNNLRIRIDRLGTDIDALARVELVAWDANLHTHLKRLEQALSGDYMLIIREGVKDQVLTHVARRTLDMLHASLKAPDAVFRRLDDKAYGAVSIGYLAFGPKLQGAVSQAYTNIVDANQVRQDQALKSTGNRDQAKWTIPLKMELRRAACENLLQGTQFSMLTELLDTTIIMQVEHDLPVKVPAEAAPAVAFQPSITPSLQAGIFRFVAMPAAVEIAPFQGADVMSDEVLDTVRTSRSPREVTPAGVHMTHVWTARQQLLIESISARMRAAPAGSPGTLLASRQFDAVEETAVQRLADAATAKTIDDAVRLAPGMLGNGAADVSRQLSNTVNVVTAATAVSSAAVTLKVNLSVSNVNTFNPTNYNNIAPVINLPAPTPTAPLPTSVAPALCVAGDFARAGVLCTRDGNAFVISFAEAVFRDDSCAPSDLEPALTAIGRGIAEYRAHYSVEFMAKIEGFASLPKTRLASCSKVTRAPDTACRYVNHLRDRVTVAGCDQWPSDLNLALSAARAGNAAQVLESASRGAVTVDRLVANGTRTAALRGGPHAADRTVVIRLEPRPPH